jgi:hypothetical protein
MLQELTNTGDAIREAIKMNSRNFLQDATNEDEWKRHHLFLARHLSDEEWDAVALAYGEGMAALALLEFGDRWQARALEIADLVDAGCKVLFARAHKEGFEPP